MDITGRSATEVTLDPEAFEMDKANYARQTGHVSWGFSLTEVSKSIRSNPTPAVIQSLRFCAWKSVSTESTGNVVLRPPFPSDHWWGKPMCGNKYPSILDVPLKVAVGVFVVVYVTRNGQGIEAKGGDRAKGIGG